MRINRKLKTSEFFIQTARNVNHTAAFILLQPTHVARSTVKYIKTILVIFAPLSLSNTIFTHANRMSNPIVRMGQ
jgi:hypothetical protein